MPRGPAPAWRHRKEPVLDHWLQASIDRAGGKPDERGWYAEMHIRGLGDRDEAQEYVRALHRSKRHTGLSLTAEIIRDGDGYRVVFHVITKTAGRQYMLDKYGPDRSKWPYDPKRKNNVA